MVIVSKIASLLLVGTVLNLPFFSQVKIKGYSDIGSTQASDGTYSVLSAIAGYNKGKYSIEAGASETLSATLGSNQLEWLKNTLKNKRQEYRNCIVFSHTNLFREHRTLSTNLNVEELKVLLGLFQEHNVNLVIMGHDHSRSEE